MSSTKLQEKNTARPRIERGRKGERGWLRRGRSTRKRRRKQPPRIAATGGSSSSSQSRANQPAGHFEELRMGEGGSKKRSYTDYWKRVERDLESSHKKSCP